MVLGQGFDGQGNWDKLFKEKFNKDRVAVEADEQQLQRDSKDYTFQPNADQYQVMDKLKAGILRKMKTFNMKKNSLAVISENSLQSPREK